MAFSPFPILCDFNLRTIVMSINTDSRLYYHAALGCSPVKYFTLLRWSLEELVFSVRGF